MHVYRLLSYRVRVLTADEPAFWDQMTQYLLVVDPANQAIYYGLRTEPGS